MYDKPCDSYVPSAQSGMENRFQEYIIGDAENITWTFPVANPYAEVKVFERVVTAAAETVKSRQRFPDIEITSRPRENAMYYTPQHLARITFDEAPGVGMVTVVISG